MPVSRSSASNSLRSMSSSDELDLESDYTHLPLCTTRPYLPSSPRFWKNLHLFPRASSSLARSSPPNFESVRLRIDALDFHDFVSLSKRLVTLPLLASPSRVATKTRPASLLPPLRSCYRAFQSPRVCPCFFVPRPFSTRHGSYRLN